MACDVKREREIEVRSLYMTMEGVRMELLMLLCGRTEAPLMSNSSLMATVKHGSRYIVSR